MSKKLGRARRTTILLSFVSALVFVQCAAAEDPIAKGNRSLNAGQYDEALKAYSKALSRAKDDRFAQERAIAMYGLARTNARLCRVDTAEKWFRDSIALRESLVDVPGSAWLTQNYLEFARFLLSRGRMDEAAEYIARAIPMLDDLGLEYSDPIAYAELLDDYAAALKAVGNGPESEAQANRAANLRLENPGRQADFKPMPYPVDAKQQRAPQPTDWWSSCCESRHETENPRVGGSIPPLEFEALALEVFVVTAGEVGEAAAGLQFDHAGCERSHELTVV